VDLGIECAEHKAASPNAEPAELFLQHVRPVSTIRQPKAFQALTKVLEMDMHTLFSLNHGAIAGLSLAQTIRDGV
jgi:hypothetical protein